MLFKKGFTIAAVMHHTVKMLIWKNQTERTSQSKFSISNPRTSNKWILNGLIMLHKQMFHYWNRVYCWCLDYHNNHFYNVSFSFNTHGAVCSQTSHHKEVKVTVVRVKRTSTLELMFLDWLSLSTIYTFTHNHK